MVDLLVGMVVAFLAVTVLDAVFDFLTKGGG